MTESGKWLHIQKTLLLGNVKELHSVFLSQDEDVKVTLTLLYV